MVMLNLTADGGEQWVHFCNAEPEGRRSLSSWPRYDNDSDIKQSLRGLSSTPNAPSRELSHPSQDDLKPIAGNAETMTRQGQQLPCSWHSGLSVDTPLSRAMPQLPHYAPCCTAGCTQF